MKTIKAILFFVFLISFGTIKSQAIIDSTQIKKPEFSKAKQLYLITKLNDIEYSGEILSDDGREVLINTTNLGRIFILKSEIKKISKITEIKSTIIPDNINDNPFAIHYSVTTNAFALKKGTNYGVLSLAGPEVHFAISDNLSIGVISTWIASPFAASIRYSLKTNNENIHVSLGALLGTSGYFGNFDAYGGFPYANLTLGNQKKNITLGAGYGFVGAFSNSLYSLGGPVFSIAGAIPVSPKASFIFDGLIGFPTATSRSTYNLIYNVSNSTVYTNNYSFLSLMPGLRFQTKSNSAFQITLAGIIANDLKYKSTTTVPFPMFSWFFRF